MAHEHRIDIEQNRPERLELLRAQRLFYAQAKLYQNLFAVMALLLPVIGWSSAPASRRFGPFWGSGRFSSCCLTWESFRVCRERPASAGPKTRSSSILRC